jgi:hypothetical protein
MSFKARRVLIRTTATYAVFRLEDEIPADDEPPVPRRSLVRAVHHHPYSRAVLNGMLARAVEDQIG